MIFQATALSIIYKVWYGLFILHAIQILYTFLFFFLFKKILEIHYLIWKHFIILKIYFTIISSLILLELSLYFKTVKMYLKLVIWLKKWSIMVHVLYAFMKNICSSILGMFLYNAIKVSLVVFLQFFFLALGLFCLLPLVIIERVFLKSSTFI